MTIAGPVVLDIVQHFTERWNEVKTRKVSVINPHICKCLDTGIFSIKITLVMIGWPFPIMFRYLQMKPSSVRTHSLHIFGLYLRAYMQVTPIANTGTRSGGNSNKGSTWRTAKKSILIMSQLRSGHAMFKLFAVYLTGVMAS